MQVSKVESKNFFSYNNLTQVSLLENRFKKIKLDKKEKCSVFLLFNKDLTDVVVRLQQEDLKFDIRDHKKYVVDFCESTQSLLYLWNTPCTTKEQIYKLFEVFKQEKSAGTSFCSTELVNLFKTIKIMVDSLKQVAIVTKIVFSSVVWRKNKQEYILFKNFLLSVSSEYKIRGIDNLATEMQKIHILNSCSDVIFPKGLIYENSEIFSYPKGFSLFRKSLFSLRACKEIRIYLNFCKRKANCQKICSLILNMVSLGLGKKLKVFGAYYRFNTLSDFYVVSKLVLNVGKSFEGFEDCEDQFEDNKKLRKHFLNLVKEKSRKD
eukprot:snap_masked-scaffold_4-processed-gene-0.24-mRNA-1 protein AED:1.00 eAED:1.00 QI:0/0/0/0/1/1/2/0/320